MDIDAPLRELGTIDTTALREAILSQESIAWHEDQYRQKSYDVHDQTETKLNYPITYMLVLEVA